MRRAADAGDAHAFMPHDVQFHRLIVEGSGNRTLQDLWTSLHVEARTMITYVRYGDLHYIAESHLPILDGLRAQDPERTAAALREHFEYYAKWVMDATPGDTAAGGVSRRRGQPGAARSSRRSRSSTAK